MNICTYDFRTYDTTPQNKSKYTWIKLKSKPLIHLGLELWYSISIDPIIEDKQKFQPNYKYLPHIICFKIVISLK